MFFIFRKFFLVHPFIWGVAFSLFWFFSCGEEPSRSPVSPNRVEESRERFVPEQQPELTSSEHNTAGYRLYKEEKYKEAMKHFTISFSKNWNNHLAHYNYACSSMLYSRIWHREYPDETCPYHLTGVYFHLKTVLSLNPDFLEKIKTDPDLKELQRHFPYYELTGFADDDPDEIRRLLQMHPWRTFETENYYSTLMFQSDGVFYYTHVISYGEEGALKNEKVEGRYQVDQNRVSLRGTTDEGVEMILEGELKRDGFYLWHNSEKTGILEIFNDDCLELDTTSYESFMRYYTEGY